MFFITQITTSTPAINNDDGTVAEEKGDEKTIKSLLKEGEPPYYKGNVFFRSVVYLNYLRRGLNLNYLKNTFI